MNARVFSRVSARLPRARPTSAHHRRRGASMAVASDASTPLPGGDALRPRIVGVGVAPRLIEQEARTDSPHMSQAHEHRQRHDTAPQPPVLRAVLGSVAPERYTLLCGHLSIVRSGSVAIAP